MDRQGRLIIRIELTGKKRDLGFVWKKCLAKVVDRNVQG